MKNTFIVLSHPRSGTTYLNNFILSSNKKVHCYDELFNVHSVITKTWLKEMGAKTLKDNPYPLITKLYSSKYTVYKYLKDFTKLAKKKTKKEIIGFKLFPGHLSKREIDYLIINKKIPVVLLVRQNLIQAAISNEIAKITNQWDHRTKEDFGTIKVDIDRIKNFLEMYYNSLQYFEDKLKANNINFLKCYYEDLFNLKTTNTIFNFIGAPTINEIPKWGEKLNTPDRYKKIENIDQSKGSFLQ